MANAKLFAKRGVCSLVSVQVMKTSVKFAVKKEEFVDLTECYVRYHRRSVLPKRRSAGILCAGTVIKVHHVSGLLADL